MSKWVKTTAAEYDGGHRMSSFDITYNAMVQALGEPIKSSDKGYPDDSDKTDVCWSFRDDAGRQVSIWNYKNGPNYCDEIKSIEEIEGFSVWATTPEALDDFRAAFSLA